MSENTNNTGAPDIGAILSATRMKRELSIATAAMQSNLSQEIIEKLEQNRFSEIGAPVFTRGYLGLYARFLGLNEAAVSQAFNKIKGEAAKETELRITPANVESQTRAYRRSYLGSWLLLIPVVIIGGVLLYQLFDNNSWLMKQLNGAFNAPPESGEVAVSADNNNSNNEIILEVGGTTLTPEGTPLSPESPQNIPGLTPPVSDEPVVLNSNNSEAPAEQAPPESVPTNSSTRGIQLSFAAESWIEIKDSGNKKVLSKLVKAGEKVELPADGAPYNLNIGRPDGVVMLVNGQEQPLENYRQKNSGRRRYNVDVP